MLEQLSDLQTSKSLFFCFANELRQFNKLSGLLYVGIQIDNNIYNLLKISFTFEMIYLLKSKFNNNFLK